MAVLGPEARVEPAPQGASPVGAAAAARSFAPGDRSSILRSPVVTTVAEATARACVLAAERGGTEVVVLSGGVFQNRGLLERTSSLLGAAGLRVLVPERLPPNDGGIAYGQLAAAAARLAAEETNAP